MSVAIPIPLLQNLPDVNVTLAVGVDENMLVYDHDTARFVLRAPFAGLLATGATVGATAQAQAFTLGVVSPFDAPAADSTTAWQVRKADKATAVVTVDTTNGRVGIGTTGPAADVVLGVNGRLDIGDAVYFNDVFGTRDWHIAATAGGGLDFVETDVAAGRLYLKEGGNVGIGTTTPATALHVVGAATITAGIRPAADSTTALQLQNVAGASVLNVDTTNARVGIGTTAPGAPLHVVGNGTYAAAFMSGFVGHGTTAPEAPLHIVNNATIADGVKIYNGGTLTAGINIYNGNVLTYGFYVADEQKNYFSSKLGIGTTEPTTRLDIDAGALTMAEMTAPTGVANKAMLYTKDNGSGKTQICCKLGDDVEIVMFTQA